MHTLGQEWCFKAKGPTFFYLDKTQTQASDIEHGWLRKWDRPGFYTLTPMHAKIQFNSISCNPHSFLFWDVIFLEEQNLNGSQLAWGSFWFSGVVLKFWVVYIAPCDWGYSMRWHLLSFLVPPVGLVPLSVCVCTRMHTHTHSHAICLHFQSAVIPSLYFPPVSLFPQVDTQLSGAGTSGCLQGVFFKETQGQSSTQETAPWRLGTRSRPLCLFVCPSVSLKLNPGPLHWTTYSNSFFWR